MHFMSGFFPKERFLRGRDWACVSKLIRLVPLNDELLDRYEDLLFKSAKCQNEPIALWRCGTAKTQNHKAIDLYAKALCGLFYSDEHFYPPQIKGSPQSPSSTHLNSPIIFKSPCKHHPLASLQPHHPPPNTAHPSKIAISQECLWQVSKELI